MFSTLVARTSRRKTFKKAKNQMEQGQIFLEDLGTEENRKSSKMDTFVERTLDTRLVVKSTV